MHYSTKNHKLLYINKNDENVWHSPEVKNSVIKIQKKHRKIIDWIHPRKLVLLLFYVVAQANEVGYGSELQYINLIYRTQKSF